jgi:glycosyltransferase involved in cell wall biosynthesis
MMRVLLFAGELSLRGTSLYTLSLARELKLRGHKVAVLSPGGLFEDVLEEHRVPVMHCPVRTTLWRDLLYLGTFANVVREFDPQLIHIQHQDLAAIGTLVARRAGLPSVITVHAQLQERLWLPFGRPQRVIAVSEDVRQSVVTTGQFPRGRIDVIPNCVSASLSALEEDEEERDSLPIVGTVNRFAQDRGIDVLLRAARIVLDKGAKAYFLVMGDGPVEREIRALARDLDLIPHLTFALPRARVSDLFRPLDLFVSSSHSEGHGIFLLSAMAQARPVISTGVGGVLTYIKDGENGLIVPRGDVQKLASRILYLLENRAEARRLAREGFRTVREEFPLHQLLERTLGAYEHSLRTESLETSLS